jgi:hypothetical protein
MEITWRALWTIIHGMGFGTVYLLACSGAMVELWRCFRPAAAGQANSGSERFLKIYLVTMAALAWMAVLTGTYIVYPWYRAVPPPGTTSLSDFPQRLLLSSPSTAAWHSLGMEWKEHVAWLVPISITMAAAVLLRYGGSLRNHAYLRKVVLCFVAVSFLAAGVAGFFGAMLNKNAPVRGGETIPIVQGKQP